MDADLVARAQKGDETAFAALVEGVVDRFMGAAQRILRDVALADDATQQALVNMWRFLPDLRDPARFDAWSYSLLVKACYTETRRRRSWRWDVRWREADHPTVPDASGDLSERDRLDRGFRRLSVDHRAVLVLRYYSDLPLHEVADALDIPVGTVKSRLHGAHDALRSALEADARHTVRISPSEVAR